MHKWTGLAAVVFVLCSFGVSQAVPIVIDFEAYADRTNLNGVNLGGVTLTAPAQSVEVFDNNRLGASYHSKTKAVANFSSCPTQSNPLIGVFDAPVSSVSLWAGDAGGDSDSWRLEIYDATVGGNLIATGTSGQWTGAPYRNITLTGSSILRFEADFTGPSTAGIAYDDLSFDADVIPEPASMALLGLGLVALVRRRRKTTR